MDKKNLPTKQTSLLIPVLGVVVLVLVGVTGLLFFKVKNIQTPSNSGANVLGISTSSTGFSRINSTLSSKGCTDFVSTELLQALRNDPTYSALSQIGWATLNIKDLGKKDNISNDCLYTFLGNIQVELIIHINPDNYSPRTKDFTANGQFDSVISYVYASGSDDSQNFVYFFGSDKKNTNGCRTEAVDRLHRVAPIEIIYSAPMTCNTQKNINFNDAMVRVFTANSRKIINNQ